ncbi:MAG: ribokinase [Pseudomonadota bacterium]|nr:ribokinase [Pseudomonadota bacterium]
MATDKTIVILGVFVADTAYRAQRQPRIGETILGSGFMLGPGGKGSNQAVAAARLGGKVHFISRLGEDAFGELALATWKDAGVVPQVTRDAASYTGAAYVFVEDPGGNNAIIVCPGAAAHIGAEDIEANADLIRSAALFVTQLEQPVEAARTGLEIARAAGVPTILNPAPAAALPDSMLGLCTYLTPNETEAGELAGLAVGTLDQARAAGDRLLRRGVETAIVTLGEKGALLHTSERSVHVAAIDAGTVVDTTGAGDAFNGGFAVALGEGRPVEDAVRFGCAAAALSVTRPGTARSMPQRGEVDALLGRNLPSR